MARGRFTCCLVGGALIVLLAACTYAGGGDDGSEFQWNVQLNLYNGEIGGTPFDTGNMMGVRSGATDGYNNTFDAKKPVAPPAPYVYLFWDRPGWGDQAYYKADWRSPIAIGKCKTWHELIAQSSIPGNKTLAWTLGVGGTAWTVPIDHTLTLYDEGTSPNPTGGFSTSMRAQYTMAFEHNPADSHYFHIRVCHETANCGPPSCTGISITPSNPKCYQTVTLNANLLPVTSPFDVFVDFGDGSGIVKVNPASHVYTMSGTYHATFSVIDGCGQTTSCSTNVEIGDLAPVCLIESASPGTPVCNELVTFSSVSSAPCSTIVRWRWNFGDGTPTVDAGVTATHTYLRHASYTTTLTVTDAAGSTANCRWTLTVADITPPLISQCPADRWIPISTDCATAYLPDMTSELVFTEECNNPTTLSQDPPAGTPMPVGEVWFVGVTVTDSAGNQNSCYPTIVAADMTAPVVQCIDRNVTAGPGNTAPCPSVLGSASDTCDPTLTITQVPAVGTQLSVGTHTVTLTAQDDWRNTATCTATVIVNPTGDCPVSFTLSAGCWHMFSLPCDPANPAPEAVFPTGTPLDSVLCRYDPSILSYVCYSEFNPEEFGIMQAGVGYWMQASSPINVSYQGCCPSASQELSCPFAGWYMIGGHQANDISMWDCSVRNNGGGGTQLFEQAWLAGWVSDPLFAYSCTDLTYVTCGVDFTDEDSYLRQFRGYWFSTLQPNLTLIVPAP